MLLNKVVLLLLSATITHAFEKYVIPEPEIHAYHPRGFSVSIPNEPGIRIFAFHGKVNEELLDLEAGQFSKDIIRPTNNKWTFLDRRTKLNIGDTINFWLFVIKDGLGYRYDNGYFVVREFLFNPNFQHGSKNNPSYGSNINDIENKVDNEKDNTQCLQTIFNITQSLIDLQTQNNELTSKNLLLKELLKKTPNSRQLTLSGRIPPDGSPTNTVAFILSEKLNIKLLITSAERNVDGSITFDVPSLDDKLQILNVAKEELRLTKISIE
ncbi:hypothetical protein FQR65_LT01681 [Abscondita terminalis]|nr:hypothetical protein FQR65_LT01681 [Abscondita terminalis]